MSRKLIESFLKNRHIGRIVLTYTNGDELNRLHKLVAHFQNAHFQNAHLFRQFNFYFRKLGTRLNQPSHVTLYMSILYCKVFDCKQPTRTIKLNENEYQNIVTCVNGCKTVYTWKSIYKYKIYCNECGEGDRESGKRFHKWSGEYKKGSDQPCSIQTSKPTRAFERLAKNHSIELLGAARSLFDQYLISISDDETSLKLNL